MVDNDVTVTVARHDEQIKTLFRRLDAQDRLVENVNQLAISVEKLAINQKTLTDNQKTLTDNQKKIKEDVEEIKEQPAKDYHDLKRTIVTAILTGIISIALGFLFGKFM